MNRYILIPFIIAAILLVTFSCREENNILAPNMSAPAILPDEIPYEILDSGKIVFERTGPFPGDYNVIYILEISTKSSRMISLSNNFSSPCISPNGDKIAFTQYTDQQTAFNVYLMDIDGNNLKQLSNHSSQERFPAWDRGSSIILYWNHPSIYTVKIDGAGEQLIRYDSRRSPSGRMSISQDEKVIYASNFYNKGDTILTNIIFRMNIDGSEIEPLIEVPYLQMLESPRFSPNGKFIAYFTITKNYDWEYEGMKIHLYDIDQNADTTIYTSEIAGTQWSHPGVDSSIWLCWSPDGSKILFTKPVADFTSYIYVINSDGSQLTQVTSLEGVTDRSISWSK